MKIQGVAVTADQSRQLPSKSFVASSTITIDIPRDTVFKHFLLRLNGSVTTTFASGTPVADATATMDRLINYIDITANGSFTIKNVTPWFMVMQQLIANAILGERRSSAGAAASNNPTVDAKFTFGTTGQFSAVADSILISFENILAGKGRNLTLWDTRGLASAEMKISTAAFANILGFGNTAPVVWTNNTLTLTIESIETQNVPQEVYYSAWKQTVKEVSFSAQVTDFLVDINRGNFLQGLMFQARDGASGTTTTASGKVLSNTLIEGLKLIINGSRHIKSTTFQQLQAKNRQQYGLNAPYASNVTIFDGIAYMDLLTPSQGSKLGDIDTAQDVRAPLVDQVQLSVSTASGATYTSTAALKIMTNEIVPPIEQA